MKQRDGMQARITVRTIALYALLSLFACSFRVSAAPSHAAVYGTEITWIYRCNRNAGETVALTFDDGPHPRLTPIILDILKEYGIRATFFLVGENVELYPELVRRIHEEGHEIANHTHSHVESTKVAIDRMEEEVLRCEAAIGSVVDVRPTLFRPPQGAFTEELGALCDSLGYRVVLWSIDTRDWCHVPAEEISLSVLKKVRDGDIILMHDYIGHDSPTPEALKKIIPALLRRGYRFSTISALLGSDGADADD